MKNKDYYQNLALLTDDQAAGCLISVVEAYSEGNSSCSELQELELSQLQAALSDILPRVEKESLASITRLLLVEMIEDERISKHLDDVVESPPVHLDPIVTGLVLTGIVILLSTDFKLVYDNNDGKQNLKVEIKKKPTASRLIEKIQSIVG